MALAFRQKSSNPVKLFPLRNIAQRTRCRRHVLHLDRSVLTQPPTPTSLSKAHSLSLSSLALSCSLSLHVRVTVSAGPSHSARGAGGTSSTSTGPSSTSGQDLSRPLSSQCGTYKTVRARFWPWLDHHPAHPVSEARAAPRQVLPLYSPHPGIHVFTPPPILVACLAGSQPACCLHCFQGNTCCEHVVCCSAGPSPSAPAAGCTSFTSTGPFSTPAGGYPRVILGAVRSFLESFLGHLSQKSTKSSKIDVRLRIEGPCVVILREAVPLDHHPADPVQEARPPPQQVLPLFLFFITLKPRVE